MPLSDDNLPLSLEALAGQATAQAPAAPPVPAPALTVPRSKLLGDLLLQRGLIQDQQLTQALAHQKEKAPNKLLGQVLVELGFVTEAAIVETLADAYQIPFAQVNAGMVDLAAVSLLPREFLTQHNLLPIVAVEGRLTVAVQDFTNVFLAGEIGRLCGHQVDVVAATAQNIREVREMVLADGGQPAGEELVSEELPAELGGQGLQVVEKQEEEQSDLETAASDSPVINLVNSVIVGAIAAGASDVHLEAGAGASVVRYRLDGVLFDKLMPPPRLHPAIVSRIKIMARMDISERRVPQDGALSVVASGRTVDLRVSTMPGKYGEKVVLRIIDSQRGLMDLGDLGLEAHVLERLRRAVHQPNGVVLVTGPTGSGKSTTLYACLKEIVNKTVNVSTIEDPVELNLPRVNQFQVNVKAGFTFATALRAMLRQDPDIIMVGEIRDQETAQIATQAALTGHLVLSTLHTNDAPSAVTRLAHMGVERYLIAASLRAVLAQRLVRKICRHCKEPVQMTPLVKRALAQVIGATEVGAIYQGKGCPRCRNTGYSGRIGVYELLVPGEPMLEAISRGVTLQELVRLTAPEDYTTLRDDGLRKLQAGVISLEGLLDVVSRAADPVAEETQRAA